MELTTLGILISAGIFIVGLGSLIFVALSVGFSLTNSRLNKLNQRMDKLEDGQIAFNKRMDKLEDGLAELKQLIQSELQDAIRQEIRKMLDPKKALK